jgi:hypothetical protein
VIDALIDASRMVRSERSRRLPIDRQAFNVTRSAFDSR